MKNGKCVATEKTASTSSSSKKTPEGDDESEMNTSFGGKNASDSDSTTNSGNEDKNPLDRTDEEMGSATEGADSTISARTDSELEGDSDTTSNTLSGFGSTDGTSSNQFNDDFDNGFGGAGTNYSPSYTNTSFNDYDNGFNNQGMDESSCYEGSDCYNRRNGIYANEQQDWSGCSGSSSFDTNSCNGSDIRDDELDDQNGATSTQSFGRVELKLARFDQNDSNSPIVAQIKFKRIQGISNIQFEYPVVDEATTMSMLGDSTKSQLGALEILVKVEFTKGNSRCRIQEAKLTWQQFGGGTPKVVKPKCKSS
jgi:hypothetical protein